MAIRSELDIKENKKGSEKLNLSSKETENIDYIKEYIHVIILGFVFCVYISILTYNPADPSAFNINSRAHSDLLDVTNTFGKIGANVSDWFYQVFGIGSLVFGLVFIAQLLNTFRRPSVRSRFVLRIFGYPQLILCYLALTSAILPLYHFRGVDIQSGGVLGQKISKLLFVYIGQSGSIIVLSLGLIASLTLALGIKPISFLSFFFSALPFKIARNFVSAVEDVKNESENKNLKENRTNKVFINEKNNIKPAVIEEKFEKDIDDKNVKDSSLNERIVKKEYPDNSESNFVSLVSILNNYKNNLSKRNDESELIKLKSEAKQIEEKLLSFGIRGAVQKSQIGPVINVHEFEPASGVKVNKILALQDDLTMALKAQSVLINLQPGKNTLAIEIPALVRETVSLKEILENPYFQDQSVPLPIALGKNVDGSILVSDLALMPHLLVAGSTGSGKSVCINSILLSLMMSKSPNQLRLILVDPKMLELSNYDGIGHLLMPVVTEPQKAAGALKWALEEMERRYQLMKKYQVRNIFAFNNAIKNGEIKDYENKNLNILPYIVIVIDELSDLMLTAPKDVEESIQRLAQKARAAGIHLILATQRPSVDVITGVIKVNLPCRISFQVSSRHDSRTIIENIGAERLLGKGDMLFLPPGTSRVIRAQCAYVSDKEIFAVSQELKKQYPVIYETKVIQDIEKASNFIRQKNDKVSENSTLHLSNDNEIIDENVMYERAVEFAYESGHISTSSIQREFRIGYNRAARIMDKMIREGIVGQPEAAGKPRPVIKRF